MAGDWIPMRMDLADDPAVIAIAAATGLDEYAVVGRLHRLWGWANRHLTDGLARGLTTDWVDRYLATAGFAAAMLNAGWLQTRSGGILFTSFDRWNSEGAKRRIVKTQQRKAQRTTGEGERPSGDAQATERRQTGDKTATRGEERREEESKEPPNPPAGGVVEGGKRKRDPKPKDDYDPLAAELPYPGEQFKALWREWVAFRATKKPPVTRFSGPQQLKKLARMGDEARAIACIEHSLAGAFQGLYEPSGAANDRRSAGPDRGARVGLAPGTTVPTDDRNATPRVLPPPDPDAPDPFAGAFVDRGD